MDDREILSKAIDKAIANGFSTDEGFTGTCPECGQTYMGIFSHSFAKAFWGEEKIDYTFDDEYGKCELVEYRDDSDNMNQFKLPAWQYHLQMMVLCENPIKYLEKFI